MTLAPALAAQQGTVGSEALLGRLLWYSVPESTCLDPKIVRDELTALGFTRKVPKLPAEVDVFRRVTKHSERNRIPHNGHDDQFENWMIREVTSRKDNVLARRLVVEVVDPAGRRLEYEQILDLEFVYPVAPATGGSIKADWINGFNGWTHPEAQKILSEIRSEFERWKGKFHNETMRNWIRQSILEMGAVAVRPTGGIYFLKEEHATQVEALESFVATHFPPGGECHSVEIPDTGKQREMLQRAIEAETTGAIDKMMLEIAEIKKAGRLTPKKYEEMIKQVHTLEKKMADYTSLLAKDMKAVTLRVEVLAGMTQGLAGIQKKKRSAKDEN